MDHKQIAELEENKENSYDFSISNEEYVLSMIINNLLFEFKLQQKNSIGNYCYYNSQFYLEKINQLLNTSFKRIIDVFDFFDKILKEKRVELIKSREKPIINLKFKNSDLKHENDIILELKQNHENLFNEFQFISFKYNNLDKNIRKIVFDALNTYDDLFKNKNLNDEIDRNEMDLSLDIKKLYQTLNINLGETEIFREIIKCIFVYELRKTKNDSYKLTLLDIVINNNNLIIYSYPFMKILFEFISSEPNLIGENLKMLQENQIPCIDLINNTNNEILNQFILTIFENKINIFFESIPNISDINYQNKYFKKYFDHKNNNNEINPTLIISDKSLELFKDCINMIENIYNNKKEGKVNIKNELLCKLYSIAYIKIYLFKFVFFLILTIINLLMLKKYKKL